MAHSTWFHASTRPSGQPIAPDSCCPAAMISPVARISASVRIPGTAGFEVGGHHHAHGQHSPYWWLKCAVGVHKDSHPLARAYHRLLVWDIMKHPPVTRLAERALNPLIGKSIVVYAHKPPGAPLPTKTAAGKTEPARAHARG